MSHCSLVKAYEYNKNQKRKKKEKNEEYCSCRTIIRITDEMDLVRNAVYLCKCYMNTIYIINTSYSNIL